MKFTGIPDHEAIKIKKYWCQVSYKIESGYFMPPGMFGHSRFEEINHDVRGDFN